MVFIGRCLTVASVAILSMVMTGCSSNAVAGPTLSSISVTPAVSATLSVGASEQFLATATFSDGSTAPVTSQVTWASSNPAVASIFSISALTTVGTANGLATGISTGTTGITATIGGVTSSAANLTVVAASPLVSIAVSPASPPALEVGGTQWFTAIGTYANGSSADITTQVTWASSNTAVATISSTTANVNNTMGTGAGTATNTIAGMAVGKGGSGSTNITASLGGVTSPAVVLQQASS